MSYHDKHGANLSLLTRGQLDRWTKAVRNDRSYVVDRISHQVSGEISKVWFESYVYEAGKIGIRIHIALTVHNREEKSMLLLAHFGSVWSGGSIPLQDFNNLYRDSNGNVATSINFSPMSDSSMYDDLILFIPYDELHLLPGYHNLQFVLGLYDTETQAYLARTSYYGFFLYKAY